jgi:hypothetical protein
LKSLLLLVVTCAYVLAGCSTSSITMTGTARDPVPPEAVRVYAEPPVDYDVIAMLEAAPAFGWTRQGRQDKAIAMLKAKAGSVGANGILLTGAAETGGGSGAGVGVSSGGGVGIGFGTSSSSTVVYAKAIYVRREE